MNIDPVRSGRAMRLSLWEGAAWALMVGLGETYFIVDAIRLGATPIQISLTVTLPLALAGAGPLLVLALLRHRVRRKHIVVFAAGLQSLALAGLALLERMGLTTPDLLIVLACVYQMMGQGAGTAWSSWFGDLVPLEGRGKYFGKRNQGIYAATLVGLITAGVLLHGLEPSVPTIAGARVGGTGFQVAFMLASMFRMVSAVLLLLTPEPPFSGLARRDQARRFLGSRRGTHATRLIAFAFLCYFAAYLSSPYYGAFMLETLRFTYIEYTIALTLMIVTKFFVASWWGSQVDRHGAGRVWILSLAAIALTPLPWLFADGLGLVLLAQALSGASWSGFELGYFTLLIESSTRGTRPSLFAAQSLVVGWSQLGAGVASAFSLPLLGGDYRSLMLVSMVTRVLVAILAVVLFRELLRASPVSSARWVSRFVGIRASGGLARRPVLEPSESPDDA